MIDVSKRSEFLNGPIVVSPLFLDIYKIFMGQLEFHHHRSAVVEFAFTNRTKDVKLGNVIDIAELKEQIAYVQQLKFDYTDISYLRGINNYGDRMLKEDFLAFLKDYSFPEVDVKSVDGDLHISVTAPVHEATYWETIILTIVNGLYYRAQLKSSSQFEREKILANGVSRLAEKIDFLKAHSELTFSDFGTRRCFHPIWQDYVVRTLKEEISSMSFRGTSNVKLAIDYGIESMGTAAHQDPMMYSGLYKEEDNSHGFLISQQFLLNDWEREFGYGLLIMLPDTYSTDYFLEKIITPEIAKKWKGSRQDSGDPIAYGEKWLKYYAAHGIDAREKMIIFSDGLTVQEMLRIYNHFAGKIKVTFGWGTNLTNDLGLAPLSIVMKLVKVNGTPVIKLSDNIEKAIGDPTEIAHKKKQVGYHEKFSAATVY